MALSAKEKLFQKIVTHYAHKPAGFTAQDCADFMQVNRSVISHYLNRLCDDGHLSKENTRPVRFFVQTNGKESVQASLIVSKKHDAFQPLIGAHGSLAEAVALCRSAVDYPGDGLPILLSGESGVGKSHLATLIYQYALERGVIAADKPFVELNCADYANTRSCFRRPFSAISGALSPEPTAKNAAPLMMPMAGFCSSTRFIASRQRTRKSYFCLWTRGISTALAITVRAIRRRCALSSPQRNLWSLPFLQHRF